MLEEDTQVAEPRRSSGAPEAGSEFRIEEALAKEGDLDTDIEVVRDAVEDIEENGSGTVLAVEPVGATIAPGEFGFGNGLILFVRMLCQEVELAPQCAFRESPGAGVDGLRNHRDQTEEDGKGVLSGRLIRECLHWRSG